MTSAPPSLSTCGPATRALHEGIDARIRRTGVPDMSPEGPTVLPDLLGARAMVAWQEVKADTSLLAERCWSEQPTVYGRYGTDAGGRLIDAVRALYQARAVVLADSGAQAVALAIDTILQPGDHAILARQIYGKSRIHLEWVAQRIGATITLVDHLDAATLRQEVRPHTSLVLVETYSNPLTRALDPDEVSEAALQLVAVAPRLRVVVDDTIATPWGPRTPLLDRPGLALIVGAGTKAISGHDQDLLGYLATQDLGLANAIMDLLATRGGVLSWRAAEAILDRLPESEVFHARRCASATRIAAFLAAHPAVSEVFHPSLPNHPDRAVIDRAWARPGSLLAFRVAGLDEAGTEHVCNVLAMTIVWRYALSFDGLASRVNHHTSVSEHFTPAPRLRRQGIDRLVRLGVGIEDADDLIAALAWALEAAPLITPAEVAAWQVARAAELGVPWPHARPTPRDR